MKIRNKILVNVVMIVILTTSVRANSESNTLKVALTSQFSNKVILPILNKSLLVGYDLEFSTENGTLVVGDNLKFEISTGYYVETVGIHTEYSNAYNETNKYMVNSTVNQVDTGLFRVLLGPFSSENIALEASSGYDTINNPRYIKNVINLKEGDKSILMFINSTKNPQIIDMVENIKLSENRHYRGIIEIFTINNKITPVNIVDREKYLYSVVPSEMPKSWELEALKAQSVAARTYSYSKKSEHIVLKYDVVDTVYSQVYLGALKEDSNTKIAVDETKNQVLEYNGELISAVFHSSSGGLTVNSEDVWGEKVPYLRGVIDSYDKTGKIWELEYSVKDLEDILADKYINIGNIVDVRVSKRTTLGRPVEVTFYGNLGSHTVEKDKIRSFFSSKSTKSLYSTNFEILRNNDLKFNEVNKGITEVIDVYIDKKKTYKAVFSNLFTLGEENTYNLAESEKVFVMGGNGFVKEYGESLVTQSEIVNIGDGVLISGKGYGHGVGLSQHGANGMAKEGFKYDEILKHYYQGVNIKTYGE